MTGCSLFDISHCRLFAPKTLIDSCMRARTQTSYWMFDSLSSIRCVSSFAEFTLLYHFVIVNRQGHGLDDLRAHWMGLPSCVWMELICNLFIRLFRWLLAQCGTMKIFHDGNLADLQQSVMILGGSLVTVESVMLYRSHRAGPIPIDVIRPVMFGCASSISHQDVMTQCIMHWISLQLLPPETSGLTHWRHTKRWKLK